MVSSEGFALGKNLSEQEIFPVRVIRSEEYSPRSGGRGSLSPGSGRPDQGVPLGFNDLIRRPFRSHRIAQPPIVIAVALGRSGCGQIEPFVGENQVLRDAVTLVIAQAEPALRKDIALRGRALIEVGGRS